VTAALRTAGPRSGHDLDLPADAAHAKLKELTGQDFGRDIKAWREWLKNRQPGQMPSQE